MSWLVVLMFRVSPELPLQHVCKEEVVLAEQQQLCNQERNSRLNQEKPELPQRKEEQEELCSSQVRLRLENQDLKLTSTYEENDQREDQTLDQNPAAVNISSISSKNIHVAEGWRAHT